MEIERKFLLRQLPEHLEQYESHFIEQAYLCINPVVRVRREDDHYYMTYKGKGLMVREEYNLPLNADAYTHLLAKSDGRIITKHRYHIPIECPLSDNPDFAFSHPLTVELDLFEGDYAGLCLAEVEFESEEEANAFHMLDWFSEDVTCDGHYHNSYMAMRPD